jgi:TRAP-type C4-dicarboxylate transport system permease small subunit
MSRPLSRLADHAERALEIFAAIAVIVMMLHVVANAMMRTVANSPIDGTNEYVGYWYLPLVAFIGFVIAQRRSEHIEARLIFDRLPKRNQREIAAAGLLLVTVTCAGFAWYGLQEAIENYHLGLTAGVTGVTIWPVTFIVPVSFVLLGMLCAVEAIADLLGVRDPADHPDPIDNPDEAAPGQ